MPPQCLIEVAELISFHPYTSIAPKVAVQSLPIGEQSRWYDEHRRELEDEICRIGSSTFGVIRPYRMIVQDLAKKLKVQFAPHDSTDWLERAIIAKLWNSAREELTAEQIAALRVTVQDEARRRGKTLAPELVGLTALSAAQLSGFGVYILGSTLLGALNGALGLSLGFGAFMGMSSVLATIIGPIGWSVLGLSDLVKLASFAAPNSQRILPVVIYLAIQRPPAPVAPRWRKYFGYAMVSLLFSALAIAIILLILKG